ncbi:MAG: nuclear transport factor 2 family protein [Saprospiraceae bacterium]|jgi:hypothetical protein|nr:nuclear transport factor 2 family protein [Saprospiraceae bacterium]MBL0025573.1 nuclear transport factor 2 family protein [Saprospiraceae bacterium]
MFKLIPLALCLLLFSCKNAKTDDAAAMPETPATVAPAEITDAKYIDVGKAGINALSAGDVAKWMESYADNAIYRFNNGDSIVGKPAITEYWTNRRTKVMDSISFAYDIWLPVKVNTPANEMQAPGVWLLGWYQVTAKYKTGKSMTQWVHTDLHFDASDKIDIVIQYLDRTPIAAAMAK